MWIQRKYYQQQDKKMVWGRTLKYKIEKAFRDKNGVLGRKTARFKREDF